eukprot:gene12517-8572_t
MGKNSNSPHSPCPAWVCSLPIMLLVPSLFRIGTPGRKRARGAVEQYPELATRLNRPGLGEGSPSLLN